MILQKECNYIEDSEIKRGVEAIVAGNEHWYENYPVSISGKYHKHEPTMEIHIKRCVYFAREFIRAFNLSTQESDILIAACILHDVGLSQVTRSGDVKTEGWKYYPETGWSRKGNGWDHPIRSSLVIGQKPFKNSRRIQDLVETHMEHWYSEWCRRPSNLLECLCAMCDYLASRENIEVKDIYDKVS